MAKTKVLILEGSSGHAFFLKEILLAEGLVNRVDLAGTAALAIQRLQYSAGAYDLIIINLVEAWEQGLQLGFWLCEQPTLYPTILIVPPEVEPPLIVKPTPVTILKAPISLVEFLNAAQAILKPSSPASSSRPAQNREAPLSLLKLYKSLAC